MSRDHSPFYTPHPNPSRDNNNPRNTTSPHNHNANAQNQNNNAFNRYSISYINNIPAHINNTSNEIEEVSTVEIAWGISETLPVLPNPDSILPGTTIHQRQEWINAPGGRESRLPLTDGTEREIMIAVMGVTGAGKSYFIREVSDISDVEAAFSLRPCTTDVQPYSFPYAGVKVTLVDTPGFNDTTKSDTQVLKEICTWMSSNYKKGKFSGIIYLQRITDACVGGPPVRYVRMFQRLCGPNALPNVLLTTTQWSNVDQELGERYEGELRSGDFWGGLIREGASIKRFMGTRESGLELIDKLIGNQPGPIDIRNEMVGS